VRFDGPESLKPSGLAVPRACSTGDDSGAHLTALHTADKNNGLLAYHHTPRAVQSVYDTDTTEMSLQDAQD